ncbi:hypothetical protein AAHZ94_27350 [Streptomyces sp. HSW2009]|uniref:hypothetical protein n=1 Tax=Streptomyces sp. HSW2009 TaxID=3142890 RepID=UPI0032EF1F8F
MAFGRRKQKEQVPPLPMVDWRGVREFTIGMDERKSKIDKRKVVQGVRAIRVPGRDGEDQTFAPCAYFATNFGELNSVVYEDAEFQRVLCTLGDPLERDGEQVYHVCDGRSEVIGAIRRIPPTNRLVRHTWRIDQPGRPVIVARNKWAKKDAKGIAVAALDSTLDFMLRSSGDGSASSRGRELEWETEDGEFVMYSCGHGGYNMHLEIEIEARWLDRRLAFAYATLRDMPYV